MRLPLPALRTDAALIRALRANDRAAFESVVSAHYESIYRQLWHLCGHRDRAADLTQEAFLEAWSALASYEGRACIRTWLHTIAIRVWYRHRRRAASRITETTLGESIL